MYPAIAAARARFEAEEGLSLLVLGGGGEVLYKSREEGIGPLFRAVSALAGAVLADKIIGKAAALLAVYGRAAAVYGRVMSRPAMAVLEKYNIPFEYENEAEHIINRLGLDICPMEKLVLSINSPEAAHRAIGEKLAALGGGAD